MHVFHAVCSPYVAVASIYSKLEHGSHYLHSGLDPLQDLDVVGAKQGESWARSSLIKLLFPPVVHLNAYKSSWSQAHPVGCSAVAAQWLVIVKLACLFVLWITTMVILSGCHYGLYVTDILEDGYTHLCPFYTQNLTFVPKRFKNIPGLPRRFYALSTLVLSLQFESYINGGLFKLRKPKKYGPRYKPPTYKHDDPLMSEQVEYDYGEAIKESVMNPDVDPPRSFSEFCKYYKWRCDSPERARMISRPRWHAKRKSLLSLPNAPILSWKEGKCMLDQRLWLQGEWESDWDPATTLAACPRVKTQLENVSMFLPKDAVYGNLSGKLTDDLILSSESPVYEETELQTRLSVFKASKFNSEWFMALQRNHNENDGLIPIIVDTGCSYSATPNK